DGGHVRVAIAGGPARRSCLVEPRELVVGELDLARRDVLLKVSPAFGPGDRNDVLPLVEYPRQRELRRGDALLLREVPDGVDDREVALEVLALEAGIVTAEIAFRDVLGRAKATREEASPQRAVGDEPDPQLARGRQDLLLDVPRPQRVLGLER